MPRRRGPRALAPGIVSWRGICVLAAAGWVAFFILPPPALGQMAPAELQSRVLRGDADAANTLGNMYAQGEGVGQDFVEAIRMYQVAADGGLAVANFNLGLLYETGRGVAPDAAVAFQYYLKAAEKGVAAAQFNVGNMYANGLGVAQDVFESLLWFRQAADQGLAEAQYNLALAYEHGRGIRPDEAMARRWYRLAATQGNVRAYYNLALMLEEGRGGPPNLEEALTMYRTAAIQGFGPAQNNLGLMLAAGRVGTPNMIESYQWLTLAVENGMSPEARELVAGQLSAEERAQADQSLAEARAQLAASGGRGVESPHRPADGAATAAALVGVAPMPPGAAATAAAEVRPAGERAPPAAEVSLQQLALSDERIARLIFDRRRLSQESLRANLRLLQVAGQLRELQDRERLRNALRTPLPSADPSPEQVKRMEILRRTIVKLAEENRWLHASQAEVIRLRAELERQHAKASRGGR